jgi:hypothetical protein
VAPPRKAMKSRRLIGDHLVWSDMQLPGRSAMLSVQYGAEHAKFHRWEWRPPECEVFADDGRSLGRLFHRIYTGSSVSRRAARGTSGCWRTIDVCTWHFPAIHFGRAPQSERPGPCWAISDPKRALFAAHRTWSQVVVRQSMG